MTVPKPQFTAGELNVYSSPRDVSDVTRALRSDRPQGDAGADDGRPARGSPGAGPGRQAGPGRRRGGVDLRQPVAVRRGRGSATRTRARSTTTSSRAARRRRRDRVHADGRRHVPGRRAHDRAPRSAGRRARRCRPPNAFRRCADRRAQAAADRAPGSRVLRREGLPAAGADPADGRRPQRRHADRRRADRAGSRRAGAVVAQSLPRRRRTRAGGRAVGGAARGHVRRIRRQPRRRWTPPAPCSTRCPPSTSTTSRCGTRCWARACRGHRAACSSPPGSAAPGCSTTSLSTSEQPPAPTDIHGSGPDETHELPWRN